MALFLRGQPMGVCCLFLLSLITIAKISTSTPAGTTTARTTTSSSDRSKSFKQDVDVMGETGSGERLRLHSEGILGDLVDLDSFPQIKRVVCTGNRLLLAMTDSTVAHGWRQGQVVLGSPQWNCKTSFQSDSSGVQIYVRISRVVFTVEGRKDVSGGVDMVTIYHVPAGPFDMLREAIIHFHYQAPMPQRRHHDFQQRQNDDPGSARRFRRSLNNLVSSIVDNVDWQANVSAVVPFDIGDESGTLALHKTWGQKELSKTPGAFATDVSDDFVLLLGNLVGENRVSFTFDLVIKNKEGSPELVRYISQFDVESDVIADATVNFTREMGVTYNTTMLESPAQELLRVPVIKTIAGLPPVNLVVTAKSLVTASVHAYSSGPSTLRAGYTGRGFTTSSQRYDLDVNKGSDVTSREWSVQPLNQSLVSRHRTDVNFIIQQKLTFNAAVSWHNHDIDLELSPPVDMTLRQAVSLRSSEQGLARCLDSGLTVDAEVHAAASQFTLTAFGLPLWDVPLQPAMSRTLRLSDTTLGRSCDAKCPSSTPSQLTSDLTQPSVQPFTRADQGFQSLRILDGDLVLFLKNQSDAEWCGSPGKPCFSCHSHTYDMPSSRTCASRLMTSRMAAVVSHLARLIEAEWPQKQLLIMEAWDEATSENPGGTHEPGSLYKVGRAVTLGLAVRSTTPSQLPERLGLDLQTLDRLGQLAVCSGLARVQREVSDSTLRVEVTEDGASWRSELDSEDEGEQGEEEYSEEFWDALNNMDVSGLHPHCVSAPRLEPGTTWPDVTGNPESLGKPEFICGPVDKQLLRTDWRDMARLVHFTSDNASLTFEPEALQDGWCGVSSRRCLTNCTVPSHSLEPWDWCSTRMMTPRLALGLRTLQKLSEMEGIGLRVTQGFKEQTPTNNSSPDLFSEGRALRLRSNPAGHEMTVASLAVCAGLDFVEHSNDGHVTVYVTTQHGYRSQIVEFMEGSTHTVISPASLGDNEHTIPTDNLNEESDLPPLVDGGYRSDVYLSEHVTTGNVTSRGNRYFRFDALLLVCIEMVIEDFSLPLEIVDGSAYRTRSDNFLHNLDARHKMEQWRYQTGQAVRLRPLPSANSNTLFLLAKSVLRVCPLSTQQHLKAVGLGCHNDSIYVDIHLPVASGSLGLVSVWDTDTDYCRDVNTLRASMLEGGPVVQNDASVTCRDRGLDPGMEFLAFQMGQTDLCDTSNQSGFCTASLSARKNAAERLQEVLTKSAGHGRLPLSEIIGLIRECLVNHCGGCMGSGPVFDAKVKHCSTMVRKYLESAAAPYPDLVNVTTFFNTNTNDSTVHGAACEEEGNVCVEDTIIYSLLLPIVTDRFFPDPGSSVEKELFDAAFNPTPLLDIAAQELAIRASGLVTVFVQAEGDINILRNVLKVLLVFNKNVSLVEIQVTPNVDADIVTSDVQKKVTVWAGTTCPEHSRFAIAPFRVVKMDPVWHKRSAELSQYRNLARSDIFDWESEWLKKML